MIKIRTHDCETTGRLFVELKANVDRAAFLAKHNIKPEFAYNFANIFVGKFNDATVDALQASPDVEWIEEDAIMYLHASVDDTS